MRDLASPSGEKSVLASYPMPGVVKVLAFAGARDAVGADAVDWPLDEPCRADDLLDRLRARFPALAAHGRSVRLAINGSYAAPGDAVREGDEVALIPPVAGG